MNKHLHRIVFNETRGQLMVVAETATGEGKSGSGRRRGKRSRETQRTQSFALFVALGLAVALLPPANAQIVAYRAAPGNQQPTVLNAGNGVPLINIQTPSAAGVSHNRYGQFDVQPAGAILNNARNSTQTLLGGWVQGNPWLAAGTARVILNEVVSANPSLLHGYVEVAGNSAQVVVANPSGVTCDGCGFINANRVTLTTGALVMNGGNLDSYRVTGGTIRIAGAGLDASRVDYTELIARAVEVNAGVWAKDLKVTAGTNQVDAANVYATPIAGSGPAPVFAIDVAHLGGMYANKIVLVGTEAGVGVRNAGTIGAAAGEVVVTADGKLVNPGTLIGGDHPLTVSVRGLDNAGTISSEGNLTLASVGDIVNSGLMHAGRELSLDISGQLANRQGTLEGQRLAIDAERLANDGGTLRQNGTQALAVSAGRVANTAGALIGNAAASGIASVAAVAANAATTQFADGRIAVRGTIDNSGTITASGAVSLSASAGLNNAGTLTLNRLDASGESGQSISNSGTITAASTDLAAPLFDNRGGTLTVAGQLDLTAHDIVNAHGTIHHSGADALSVALAGDLDNRGGQIASTGPLTIAAREVANDGGTVSSQGRIDARIAGELGNASGQFVAGSNLALTTIGRVNNAGGTLGAVGGSLDATLGGVFDNRGGRVEAATCLALASSGLSNVGGTVLGQAVAIDTRQQSFDNSRGTVSAGSALSVASGQLTNTAGRLQAAGALTIDSHGQAIANTGGGKILGQAGIALTAGALDNSSGLIASADALGLTAGRLANLSGRLSAQNGMTLASGALLDNRGGDIQSGGDLSASASTIDNDGGLMRAANTLTVSADRLVNASTSGADQGLEGRSLVIAANAIDNRSGALRATDALSIDSAGTLDNSNGLISSTHTLALRDAQPARTLSVSNSGGTMIAGTDLTLRANRLSGDGRILSHGDLTVDLAADFVNTSEVTADRNASLFTAGSLSNSGTLQAGSTLAIQAASLDNTAAGKIAGETLRIRAAGTLTNRGLIDGGDAFIDVVTVDNLGSGRIYGNHLAIAAAVVNNHPESGVAPVIAARERLDIGAWAIDNRDGALLFSAGDLAIGGVLDANHRAAGQAGTIANSSATIEALGNLAINAASVVNQKTAFATTRITSGTPEGGIALLDYVPELEFHWGYKKTGTAPWRNYIRERYLDAITKLLGGGPDAALVAAFNPPPPFDPEKPVGPDNLPPYDPDLPIGPYNQPPPPPYQGYMYNTIWGDLTGYTGPVGGGLDAAYRSRLAAVVNAPVPWVFDDSHKLWKLLIDTIAAERPEYIDRMAKNLAARGPLQFAYRQICVDTDDCDYVSNVVSTSVSHRDVVAADSPAAVIRAGGNATINASALENRYSVIQSGGNMALTGGTLSNVGAEFYLLTDTTSTTRTWHWISRDQGSTTSASSTQTLIGSAPAIISAGGALSGSFSNRIDNIAIRQNAARVVGQIGSTPGTSGTAGVGTTAAGSSSANTASTFGTAPARVTRVAATGAASGPNGVVATAALGLTLPASRLLHVNPNPAGHYLVETDPAFASYRTWLSSDYLLGALELNPATTQKRLGDGFYEQRLITEQVAQLTGRRFLSGYATDEAQYRALMTAGATVAAEWGLVPGVALSEAQMARLTTDIVWLVEREVTQADGTTAKVLVPQVYARVRDGDLDASGALIAGNDVQLATAGDLTTSGTIAGRQVVALTAENIADLRGRIVGRDVAVQAANDLTVLGGSIEAERTLLASAGNDLTVASTTVDRDYQNDSTGTANSVKQTTIDRVAGLYVTGPGGTLVASAGNDLTLLAAVVANAAAGSDSSAGQTYLAAGKDLVLGTVTERSQAKTVSEDVRWSSATRTEFGTAIQTTGDLALVAGQDLTARAASVNSAGALTAQAGRDLTIEAGQSAYEMTYDSETSRGGFLSSRSSSQHDKVSTTTAQSSTFSGDTVALRAGQDIAIKGSNVVSDQGTILVAQRNLTIESAQETHNESHFKEDKEFGIFSSGGVGFTIGSRQLSVDQQASGTTALASTVGSTAGNVTLLAGQDYRQVGSDVLAPRGDINISAQKVDIVEARETSQSRTEVKSSQNGLTVAVSNPVISAIQTAQQMSTAASQTGDSRMQALAAANTAMAGNDAMNALEKGQGRTINGKEGQIETGKDAEGKTTSRDANAADQAGGINVSISVGSSQSSSTSTQRSDTAAGSTIAAGGNVSITATGAGAGSDLTIQGSRISAGNDVKLKAEDEIRLLAARSFSEQHGSSESSSASIGVSIGTDGFLLTVGASGAHGKADGADTSWTNTHLSAGNTVSLESGGDTTLKGAVASGEQVVAKVGGNLSIESVQDTSRYDSKEQSLGGSISIGYGKIGGSLSASQSKVSSDYASVARQSGIKAGDGGFQVEVKGTTDLKGAVIASTEQAVQDGKNRFATAGLTLSDIANKAEYEASASSVNFGSSLSFAGKLAPSGTGVGIGTASGSAASTTQSGISAIAGNQAVRTGDAETGIAKIFDADKVKQDIEAQVQITQLFGQQASKAVGDYAADRIAEANALRQEAKTEISPERISALEAQAKSLEAQWGDQGSMRLAAHALVGGLTGGFNGATGAASGTFSAALVTEKLKEAGISGPLASTLTTLASTASGAAVGGSVGAGTALNEVANNTLYHYKGKFIAYDKDDNDKIIELSNTDMLKLVAKNPEILQLVVTEIGWREASILPIDASSWLMTASSTLDLGNPDDRSLIAKESDMGYKNLTDKATRIYVQTGMDNTRGDAEHGAMALSRLLGQPVGYINNGTEGLAGDLGEYLPDTISKKDVLNEYTLRILNSKGPTLIATHSAGNEDLRKALLVGALYDHRYDNLSLLSIGSPVGDNALQAVASQSGARYLGQVNDWRDPITYSKTAGVVSIASFLGGLFGGLGYGAVQGCTAGVSGGWLGCIFLGVTGGAAGAAVGGAAGAIPGFAGYQSLKRYHLFEQYIAKPQTQTILFDWLKANPLAPLGQ